MSEAVNAAVHKRMLNVQRVPSSRRNNAGIQFLILFIWDVLKLNVRLLIHICSCVTANEIIEEEKTKRM